MKKHGITFVAIVIIGVSWTVLTSYKIVSPTIIPSPVRVALTFRAILISGYNGLPFWVHLGMTMMRLIIAILFAIIIGVPLGIWSAISTKVYQAIDFIIQFYRPIPPLAYYTVLILWFGIGEISKILLLFLAALAPIYISAYEGVKGINKEYILSAKCLGAKKEFMFINIILPAALPTIFTGLRTSIGVTFSTLVSAEMVASTSGIGWMVIDASKYLKSDVMFVGILLLGFVGLLIDFGLKKIQEKYIYW